MLILEKGFPNDAEHYLREALKLDKDNYEATYRLGLVLQRQGHNFKAARYYKKVLKARPGYAEARFMLALAEERCGRRDAAIKDYVRAYRHAPDLANPDCQPSRLRLAPANARRSSCTTGRAVEASTLKVTPIDPAAVRQMMQVNAARAGTPVPSRCLRRHPEPPAQPTVQAAARGAGAADTAGATCDQAASADAPARDGTGWDWSRTPQRPRPRNPRR